MTDSSKVRAAAARVVSRVVREGVSLDNALADGRRSVDAGNGAFLQALCYETIRWHGRLAAMAAQLLDKPLKPRDHLVESLILVGLCQLEYLRVPPHAAVAETVQATRALRQPRASGLVNAVLRRFQRERDAVLGAADRTDAGRYATPSWLIDSLSKDWPDYWRDVLSAGNEHPPMWLRVNLSKTSAAAYRQTLARAIGAEAEPGAMAPGALQLAAPLDVQALPGFAEGLVSVQDAAAQIASGLLDLGPGHRVLDACAAPGGKTGAILESALDGLRVTALDASQRRLERVAENLDRLGLAADIVAGDALDPADWWDGEPYDRILVDAPCSATGVIRRHPDIKLLRRADDVAALAQRQLAMLEALWPLLADGGRLVYATCSVLREENEQVVHEFLDKHDDARPLACGGDTPAWGRSSGAGRQILTGEAGMDGFYYACLTR